MTGSPERTNFEFTTLKSGVRIAWTQDGVRRKVMLSLPMWWSIKNAKKHDVHGGLTIGYGITENTHGAMGERGLLAKVLYQHPTSFRESADFRALTPLAVDALDAGLPDPPPVSQWPGKKKKEISPDNIRVTPHQKRILWGISTGGGDSSHYHVSFVDGFSFGDPDRVVEERWVMFGKGCFPYTTETIRPLVKMKLLELGINTERLALVVRPTVHGALLAEAPNGKG